MIVQFFVDRYFDSFLTAAAPSPLTRDIFGNIPTWGKVAFYVIAAIAVAVWLRGILRRMRLWRQGVRSATPIDWPLVLRRLTRDVVLQYRLRREGARRRAWASASHLLLFSGFFVLLIGTTLVCVEHVFADLMGRAPGNPVFHKGIYFGVYEVVMDIFGIALIAGCLMFLVRRWRGEGSFGRTPADVAILIVLAVIGITGYFVEGLRIIYAQTPMPGLSPVGYLCARGFAAMGIGSAQATTIHFGVWWFHGLLALGFVALMPYTRLMHSLAGTVNLAIRDHVHGVMAPVRMEDVEETGRIGVATLAEFSRRQLIELDACVSCGRCEDSCPAYEAGKPLSPRNVVQDLVAVMNGGDLSQNVHGQPIAAETLWSCTTCTACADVCPLGISPMRMITDMRRHLIGEGALRGAPATTLQKTERAGNPWGLPSADRLAWAKGLDVPLASKTSNFEILYWVGCAASYDRRVQKVARSMARLLQAAKVNFAVLGPEERCTGESARRMGDELLFQTLAGQNVETLARRNVRKIVAHCPHCVNSLRNDYLQMGGSYEVIHHSQFLHNLIRAGQLPAANQKPAAEGATTFHDPCYLARVVGETAAPRNVLAACSSNSSGGAAALIELPRHGRQTACCGAGGGRMWFDDPPTQRVGSGRLDEIVQTGAKNVAVSCPFCLIMVGDGLAAREPNAQVRDIAEILADAVLGPERTESQ